MTPTTLSPLEVLRHRWSGDYPVDEWGYDRELVDLFDPIMALRWRVEVTGDEHLPADGPVVLVANRRAGIDEPLVLARGIRRATGRRVRFLGIPDVAPFGPALRRIGGAVARPAELAALLRAGQVVVLPLSRRWRQRRVAGGIDPATLAPALDLDVPIVPVGLAGSELFGRWRVLVGPPVPKPDGKGPLALAEVSEAARDGVQALLDEAHPPRWLLG